jgi:hypothetical protein
VNDGKAFRIAKTYLKPGLYYFSYDTHEIRPVDRQAWHIRHMPHRFIFRGGGEFSIIEYGAGLWKAVLLINDMAYGCFCTPHGPQGYAKAKKNYEMYGQLLNYPCVTHVSFDDRLLCESMSRMNGVTYHDAYHDGVVIRALLTWAASAERKKDAAGNTLFLQHGDAWRDNVIWTDESHFVFIDLDDIGYYPPLFDVFRYLRGSGYDMEGVTRLLHENAELLDEVCIKAGIDITDNPLDTLFSGYVMYFLNRSTHFTKFAFLTCENTQPYPKTNQLLRSMADGRQWPPIAGS